MKIFFFPLLLSSAFLAAQVPDSALLSLAEAERDFAKASAMYGRKNAFVSYFAEGCVIFTDKWITNGREYWEQRKALPSVLKWEPEFADISASGDFGVSTGPWELQEYRPGTKPSGTGYYLSVWQKDGNGQWKVILDAGTAAPAPDVYSHEVRFPAEKHGIVNEGSVGPDVAEDEFLGKWKRDPVTDVYEDYLSPSPVIYRNNKHPLYDLGKFQIMKEDQKIIWETSGTGKSSSGDLGYTYGILKRSGSNDPAGHYVRIWKKYGNDWRILIDMLNTE